MVPIAPIGAEPRYSPNLVELDFSRVTLPPRPAKSRPKRTCSYWKARLESRSRSSFDGDDEDVVCWPGMCRRASEVASHASIGLASTHRTYARRAGGAGAHQKGEAVRLPA